MLAGADAARGARTVGLRRRPGRGRTGAVRPGQAPGGAEQHAALDGCGHVAGRQAAERPVQLRGARIRRRRRADGRLRICAMAGPDVGDGRAAADRLGVPLDVHAAGRQHAHAAARARRRVCRVRPERADRAVDLHGRHVCVVHGRVARPADVLLAQRILRALDGRARHAHVDAERALGAVAIVRNGAKHIHGHAVLL